MNSTAPNAKKVKQKLIQVQRKVLVVGALLMDAATGSEWNFQGCAVSGKATGVCLEPVEVIKDD